MATLPTPGSDTDTWGSELNTYLSVEHDAGGYHQVFANNIGIGITPESWGSGYSALQIGGCGAFMCTATQAANNYFQMGLNCYYDSTDVRWEYIVADEASIYEQNAGGHAFHTAAVGAADGAITWSNLVTMAPGGNVGFGHPTPTAKLHLGGTAPGDSVIRMDATVSGTNWEIGERTTAGTFEVWEDDTDSVVLGLKSTGELLLNTSTETFEITDAGSTSATQQDWIEVEVGGVAGYLHVYAAK